MEEKQNWTYCVVGNIKNTHIDENGTLRYGTSAFTGGTKVYLSGRIWDRTKDHINALGISRGKRLEVIWTDVSLIENLRCQKVFNPAIIEFMNLHEYRAGWWGKSKSEKTDAEAFVKWWNENLILAKRYTMDSLPQHNDYEICESEQSKKDREYYVPLITHRCGKQTTSQIFERIIQKENMLYDWLRENPNATKNAIRKKSHEIAGTLSEYEATIGKRFYVIQPYRKKAEQLFNNGSWSFVETMVLGSQLMYSAEEIADEMPLFSESRNVYIRERIVWFVNTLSQYGIAWEADQMMAADVSEMNAEGIIALILCATWKNRLYPNTLKPFIKNGIIPQWLDRLSELDQ